MLGKEYRILHAWDGKEAVELFRKHTPHLVLMDINMPQMNGYEATEAIRQLAPNVPIIAVTAYTYANNEAQVLERGFDAFAPKPVNGPALKKQIGELLRNRLMLI